MSASYRVHLQGFSPFERSALASYFRLATHRSPAYDLVAEPSLAHFIVADADHPGAVGLVAELGRVADAVFVGAQPPEAAMAWLMRPIDPLHVLRELDALVSLRLAPQRTTPLPHGGEAAPVHRTVILPPRPGPGPSRRADDERRPPAADVPLPVARHGGSALLVGDNEAALRLALKLQRFGLRSESATTSERALALLAERPFDFVFADLELGLDSGLDGHGLCQAIRRQQRQHPARRAPVLAIVSAQASEVDRVRGALAGADGCLGKPVSDAALDPFMAQHGYAARPLAEVH